MTYAEIQRSKVQQAEQAFQQLKARHAEALAAIPHIDRTIKPKAKQITLVGIIIALTLILATSAFNLASIAALPVTYAVQSIASTAHNISDDRFHARVLKTNAARRARFGLSV